VVSVAAAVAMMAVLTPASSRMIAAPAQESTAEPKAAIAAMAAARSFATTAASVT